MLPLIVILYPIWFIYSHKYATILVQAPWRGWYMDILLAIDDLLITKIGGLNRQLVWSQPLSSYKHPLGHCWTISPHHILFPSFMLPFYADKAGVQSQLGVSLNDTFAAAAKSLFYIPLLRELVITLGGRVASPSVVGSMKTFGLAPGGVHEMIRQERDVDHVYLRRGFVRLCVKKGGLGLVPCYAFDENEIYRPLDLGPYARKAQHWLHRVLGVGLPFWTGLWGIPFCPLPNRGEYIVGCGRPIDVQKIVECNKDMLEEDLVDLVVKLYIEEVKRLFEELKEKTGRRKDKRLVVEILETRIARATSKDGKDSKKTR